MKKAFTLAEMMIVLVVIAIITSILLPAARHATPDENILKFKKAHNTLYNTIRELVNSDKYYLDGDLGIRPNGDLIDGTHDGDVTYLCNTIADVIGAKKVTCSETQQPSEWKSTCGISNYPRPENAAWTYNIENAKKHFDVVCLDNDNTKKIGAEIELPNGAIFYQTGPNHVFGFTLQQQRAITIPDDPTVECKEGTMHDGCSQRYFTYLHYSDKNDFPTIYKIFCIDIDGIDKGEDPFGYGIRVDGKIISGARADEWLEKSINQKD